MIPYARAVGGLVIAGLLAGSGWWLYRQGGQSARIECLRRETAELKRLVDALETAIDQRDAARAKADELAALPPKVVTHVRQNPSGCSLPRPVTDSVRDQVRATNEAIRAMP